MFAAHNVPHAVNGGSKGYFRLYETENTHTSSAGAGAGRQTCSRANGLQAQVTHGKEGLGTTRSGKVGATEIGAEGEPPAICSAPPAALLSLSMS